MDKRPVFIDAARILDLLEEMQYLVEECVSEMGPISSPKRQEAEKRLAVLRGLVDSVREDIAKSGQADLPPQGSAQ
jgi:hypothetical protein